ncbi:hypothetical protein LTR17_006834 [Elasticomyces elasticus]|nr:hypothetical protein LTR17_006834 [Elasticomyces elasticus]
MSTALYDHLVSDDSPQTFLQEWPPGLVVTLLNRRMVTYESERYRDRIEEINKRSNASSLRDFKSGPHLGSQYGGRRWKRIVEDFNPDSPRPQDVLNEPISLVLPKSSDNRFAIYIVDDAEYKRLTTNAVTNGRVVSDILRTDVDTTATKGNVYAYVGKPTIQYYGMDADEHSAFICMPHIDPGRDRYSGKGTTEMLNVMDFTWKATFILGDVAMNVIDNLLNSNGL